MINASEAKHAIVDAVLRNCKHAMLYLLEASSAEDEVMGDGDDGISLSVMAHGWSRFDRRSQKILALEWLYATLRRDNVTTAVQREREPTQRSPQQNKQTSALALMALKLTRTGM